MNFIRFAIISVLLLMTLLPLACTEGVDSEPDIVDTEVNTDTENSTDWEVITNLEDSERDTQTEDPACQENCQIGETRCTGDSHYSTCVTISNGCGAFSTPVPCESGFCQNNVCAEIVCEDNDSDGFGLHCDLGPDCDDNNNEINPQAPELCDQIDNNCNQQIDETGCPEPCPEDSCEQDQKICDTEETLIECILNSDGCGIWSAPASCGGLCLDGQCRDCVDEDGDQRGIHCPFGPDCDDSDPQSYPGASEICDDKDNDCNQIVDDGFDVGASCNVGTGACVASGIKICSTDGTTTRCDAIAGNPQTEQCGDEIDSDCDGNPDNGFHTLGTTCYRGQGDCQSQGIFICSINRQSLECNAEPASGEEERCDNSDNDCDGQIDEEGVCDTCYADPYEPNESSTAGTPLATGQLLSGRICPDDVDWFHIVDSPSDAPIQLEVITEWGTDDLELEIFFGSNWAGGSYNSTGETEHIETISNGERITARVYPASNSITPIYGTTYSIRRIH